MSFRSLTTWTVRNRTLLILTLFLLAVGTPYAHATTATLTLSDLEGNPTTAPYPDDMDATFNFSVVGNTLTLIVSNETTYEPQLRMDEIYFNVKSNITGLTLTDVAGTNVDRWEFDFIQGGNLGQHQVDGFGRFDVFLIDVPGNPVTSINAGASETFTFDIVGTAPVADDFIELSTQVDGHTISYAAAKFYDGGDISDFGATNVPEPATLLLLGLGGLALLRKRST